MTFMPRMTAETRAIRTVRPLSWRRWPGVIADVWHVHGEAGGGGFYRSPDPRLVVFLGDGANDLRIRTHETAPWTHDVGVFYVPAGVPMWSELDREGPYAHLDLHLDAGPLAQRMQTLVAPSALTQPRLLKSTDRINALAGMIAEEVMTPSRPDLMTDGLFSALMIEVLELPAPQPEAERGGLSPHTLIKLEHYARQSLDRRITVAELAEVAGLSESWLTRAFRQSLGTTPQRWLTSLRLATAQDLMTDMSRPLAEVAAEAGFADQAHLTRVFRTHHGQTPGDWRKRRFVPNPTSHDSLVQANR
ncbi:helix-turn-helix protein [Yoonia maritima]|uniref:Helix-turn-helix protein n=1 Tax=Yoonia maritima TaxID=1435347 RepID=A0A2T0VZK7_9RHOB|nr:AraC family transcriptional regulator [Yoonia maritima]PRY77775.1 helix-turn-helix protein [Yoonia maritima]